MIQSTISSVRNAVCNALLVLLAIAGLFSCRRDLGNYSYHDENVIAVSADLDQADRTMVISADSISLAQNDTLIVPLKLTQTSPTDDLSYEWAVVQTTAAEGNPTEYILGTTATLKTKISLRPNLYQLVARVTDKRSGVSFYKYFSLNVATAPWGAEGWVVLEQQADGADISVIATSDGSGGGSVYREVYSGTNNRKLPVGTYSVNVINYSASMKVQKVSFLYPGGGLQVRSEDFSDSSRFDSWFLSTPTDIDLQKNAQVDGGQYEYIINNGQIQYRKVNPITFRDPPIKFGVPIFGSWELSPFVLNNAGSEYYFTLYDKAHQSFFLYNMETNLLMPTNLSDVPNAHFPVYSGGTAALDPVTGSGFDLNHIGRELIYTESAQPLMAGTRPMYDCIFRNDAGDSTFLYQIPVYINYSNNFTTGRYTLLSSSNPGINEAFLFACPNFLTMPGKFYYARQDRIYTCSVAPLSGSSAEIGYEFPAGSEIKVMKVFKSGYSALPQSESKVLVVATDESASGGGNHVYFLRLDADGNIAGKPIADYSGFGPIADLAFKKSVTK